MADLYGNNGPSNSHESEEMSSFLHNLLHNSTTGLSNSSFDSFKATHAHSLTSQQLATVLSDSDGRFSDLSGFFPTEAKESIENDVGGFDFGCQVQKGTDGPENPVAPRSSKRTRAAEIHNLSEKRRRSRINEKLKALQTLIPNSNKTDKASMLDEAIEYLKQLQLQVQMLTMKNGISLQPMYVQETLPPIQRGMAYDGGDRLVNPNGGGGPFPQSQDISIRSEFDISNHNRTNPSTGIPSITNITRPETSFGLELSTENQYGLLNHLTSFKDICRANTPSKLYTDLSFSGKTPSPGVSS